MQGNRGYGVFIYQPSDETGAATRGELNAGGLGWRIQGGPFASPWGNIISFCTKTPRLHIGAPSHFGSARRKISNAGITPSGRPPDGATTTSSAEAECWPRISSQDLSRRTTWFSRQH